MTRFNVDENGHCIIHAGTTEIGECAFADYNRLESVEIPAGVTGIGKDAFARCSSLSPLRYRIV